MSAHIVHLAHAALVNDQVDGPAVVLHIQPVAHVQALAVHRQRLVVQRVGDHQRDQLLREVIRAVVVRAAGDGHRQSEGPVIGQHQQVRARLGGRVGAGGVDRRLLGKEQVGSVQRQVAVDLVGGDLVIAGDAVLAAGVHQRGRADDVGLEEDARVLDGAVHVALRREVDDDVGMLLFKELVYALAVADVQLHKAEVRVVHHGGEGREVARVGQLVQADDPIVRIRVQHVEYEVGTDESGAAGNDDRHFSILPYRVKLLRKRNCSRCLPAAATWCPSATAVPP